MPFKEQRVYRCYRNDTSMPFYSLVSGISVEQKNFMLGTDVLDTIKGVQCSLEYPTIRIHGRVMRDSPDTMIVTDVLSSRVLNHPIAYTFEPLTLQRFAEMRKYLEGFSSIWSQVQSDEDLENLILSEWLVR